MQSSRRVKIPSSPGYKRDYKQEYKNHGASPEERKKNDSRKKARRLMEKLGKVKKFDGKDVDHIDGNALRTTKNNLRVQSQKANRSFPRNKNAGKK
jgi:hypothetical protein